MIAATFINVSQFSVSGDQIASLRIGTRIVCNQGVDGQVSTDVSSVIYEAVEDKTIVTVPGSPLTSNLTEVKRGHTFVDPVAQQSNLAKHTHAADWDGGYEAFAGFRDDDIVDRLNSLGSIDETVKNYLFGVNAVGDDVEKKELVGTANQVSVTHSANLITLSGPQDLHPGATPTFAGLKLSGLSSAVVMADDDGDLAEVPDSSTGKAALFKENGILSFGNFRLDGLADVSITNPPHGASLVWDAVYEAWKAGVVGGTSGGIDVGTLFALLNVFVDDSSSSSSSSSSHADTHMDGGSDAIDGDKIEITFDPDRYIPTTVTGVTNQTDQLTSHLRGLELALLAPNPWNYTPRPIKWKSTTQITIPADTYFAFGYRCRGRYEKQSATSWTVASPFDVTVSSNVNDSWYSVFLTGTATCVVLPLIRVYGTEFSTNTLIYIGKHDDHTQYETGFVTADNQFDNYRLVKLSHDAYDGNVYSILYTHNYTTFDHVVVSGDKTAEITAGDWLMLVPSAATECLYLGAVRIDASGHLMEFRKHGWDYSYTTQQSIEGNKSGDTIANTLLSAAVPPQAYKAEIDLYISSGTTDVTNIGAGLYSGTSGANMVLEAYLETGASDVKTIDEMITWFFSAPCTIRNQFYAGEGAATYGDFCVYAFSE